MRRLQGWAPQIHARRNIAARPLGAVAAWPRRKAGAAASHAAGCHCKFWHRLRRLRLLLRRGLSRRRQGRHIPIAARQRDLGRRPRRIQRHRGERMRSTGGRAANGATSSIVGGSHGRLGSPQCATAGCSRVIGGRRGRGSRAKQDEINNLRALVRPEWIRRATRRSRASPACACVDPSSPDRMRPP